MTIYIDPFLLGVVAGVLLATALFVVLVITVNRHTARKQALAHYEKLQSRHEEQFERVQDVLTSK